MITTTIPTNLNFPNRGVLERDDFVNAQETAQDLLAGAYTTALNQYATELNDTEADINLKWEQVQSQAVTGGYSQAYIDATFTPKILNTQTDKTTPIDADLIPLSDSVSSFGLKKLSWANLKATLISSFGAMINTLASKAIPVDADIFIIGDSASLNANKKLTWANLIGNIKNVAYKSTPVAVTSWSYSDTTITLNVDSHTFVAGDYIEVSGLTATTNPANGIQLVTSVTATTIRFTLGATPTGTAGVSSATVKGYATINGRASESIGVNQTWQNVTANRTIGATYTNTTGKPIFINICMDTYTSYQKIEVGGIDISGNANMGGGNPVFVVPNGSTYKFVSTNIGILTSWCELR